MRGVESNIQFCSNDDEHNNVCCPYCKQQVINIYDEEAPPKVIPCKHFAFYYISEGFLENTSKEFINKLLKTHNNIDDFSYPYSLNKMGYDNALYVIEDEESAISCVISYYGFDKKQEKYEASERNAL